MLTQQLEKLKNNLPTSYKPYPGAGDRAFWEGVNELTKSTYIKEAEKYMKMQFGVLPASLFMEFHRNGNRSNYQKPYSERRKALNVAVLAELFENKGRFIDFIIDLIWMICEETSWIIPAHNNIGGFKHFRLPLPDLDRPIIDLMAGDTGASIATALYFFKDKLDEISPQISRRAENELDRRIIREYRDHTDYWWMGFMGDSIEQLNNWNPWINSNVLLVLLLSDTNNKEKYYILHKISQSLDAYIKCYPEDGGCDEGPGYWGRAGASLFECLEILYEYTDGAIDLFSITKIRNMCAFIQKAHISGNYYVNFADASPRAVTNPELIYRFGKSVGDQSSMAFGVYQSDKIDKENIMLGRFGLNRPIRGFFVASEMKDFKTPYVHDDSVFLEDIEVAYLRAETYSGEIFLAAKGGNNLENHNHNDVGNFMVFANGIPFIIDAGSQEYTRKTFSPNRYEIWTNCSLWHNVPKINGCQQICGHEYMAKNVSFSGSGKIKRLSMEIHAAYPEDAGLNSWRRSFNMDTETGLVLVEDDYDFKNDSNDVRFTLLTHPQPKIKENDILLESGGTAMMISPDRGLTPAYEEIDIDDVQLKKSWGEKIYRLSLSASSLKNKGNFKTEIRLL